MKHEELEVISAFLDGEPHDPRELAAALTAPGARDVLVDFVLLRAGVAGGTDVPDRAFYAAMDEAFDGPAPARKPGRRWMPALAAAAILSFAALGIWIGLRDDGGTERVQRTPPAPVRTLHFDSWKGIGS
jgi:hypothetical protein